MDEWVDLVLEKSKITIELHRINPIMYGELDVQMIEKYVDDCFTALNEISPGVRWDRELGALTWSPEKDLEDKKPGANMKALTMQQFAEVASGLISCLKFTWEIPPDSGGGVAVLETLC